MRKPTHRSLVCPRSLVKSRFKPKPFCPQCPASFAFPHQGQDAKHAHSAVPAEARDDDKADSWFSPPAPKAVTLS